MCTTMRGEPPLSYQWYKNGKIIKTTSFLSIETHDKFSNLNFEPVEESSVGNYTCVVSSPKGKDNFSAYLTVRCEYYFY